MLTAVSLASVSLRTDTAPTPARAIMHHNHPRHHRHHVDLPPIDKHVPLHPADPPQHRHNPAVTNSITTTTTSSSSFANLAPDPAPPAYPQTNDIPPTADYDDPYDRDAALQSWNATLRKSFLSRRTPLEGDPAVAAYESNSITTPTPPHSSSASLAVADLPPLPPSSAAAAGPGPDDVQYGSAAASFPSTPAPTSFPGSGRDDAAPSAGGTVDARTPSPLFLPRHTNHSLDSVGVLQLGDAANHHRQPQQQHPFPRASSSDRATAAGVFPRDGEHHHHYANNQNQSNSTANVGTASPGDDELLSVTAIALADVLRGDERAPAAYDANSRRFESVLDLDMQRANPIGGPNVGLSPSSSSSSPSTSRTTQAGGPSSTHHHHRHHHFRRRRHSSSRKRRDTLEAMRGSDPSVGVDAVDDDVDMDEVWDKFVKTMADCGPLARPDHRTVLIALLRATIANLGIRTLIPWNTDTVAHLTPGAPMQTPFNSAPYPPMHLRQPGANTYSSYSSSAYSFSTPLRGAPPTQSESAGEEENGDENEQGTTHDERQQQQQDLTSTVIEHASRDSSRNNNKDMHMLANRQRAMSDHTVTTVFLLGVGGVSASDGKESRMKRLKRAKARFLKRAILVVSGHSPTSGGGGRHGLRQHHRDGAERKHKYSDVIDMQVMLSFALTVVVVHAALARCGCDITLQTPYATSDAGVSYIPTNFPAGHSSASGSGSAATSGRRINLYDYMSQHHCSRHKSNKELDGQEQEDWQETKAVTAADFNVRATYYGAKIAFAVSFKDDAPCQVSFHHPGILAARHATRFAELVGEVRSLVETFERKVLVWECERRAAMASEAEREHSGEGQR